MSQALRQLDLPDPERFPLAYYVQTGAQATLIVKSVRFPELELPPIPGLDGLWLHRNPAAGRRLFAKGIGGETAWKLLWGQPRSRDQAGLVHGPTAFQQLLPELYARALSRAEAFLDAGPTSRVLDLYCGTGASLARWRERGAQAMGIELSREAVECAAVNAPGALVLRGTCSARVPQMLEWGADLAYLNPPRPGLEAQVLEALLHVRPSRLAYLSCSAGTLARDLEALTRGGYELEAIVPYDFFPQTHHVEALALLALS